MQKFNKDDIITFSQGNYEDYHKSDPYKVTKAFDLDILIKEYLIKCIREDFINNFDPLKSVKENVDDFYPDFYIDGFTKWLKDNKYIKDVKSENIYLGDLRFSQEKEYVKEFLNDFLEKERGK